MKQKPIFVLRISNEIKAISENRELMELYIETRLMGDDFMVEKVNDKKEIRKILKKKFDLILYYMDGYVLFEDEYAYCLNSIEFERTMIRSEANALRSIVKNYNVSSKESKVLRNASDILRRHSRSKNIRDFINMEEMLEDITSVRDSIELDNRYKFLISGKD